MITGVKQQCRKQKSGRKKKEYLKRDQKHWLEKIVAGAGSWYFWLKR